MEKRPVRRIRRRHSDPAEAVTRGTQRELAGGSQWAFRASWVEVVPVPGHTTDGKCPASTQPAAEPDIQRQAPCRMGRAQHEPWAWSPSAVLERLAPQVRFSPGRSSENRFVSPGQGREHGCCRCIVLLPGSARTFPRRTTVAGRWIIPCAGIRHTFLHCLEPSQAEH